MITNYKHFCKVVNADNTFEIFVDQTLVNSGNLLEDFELVIICTSFFFLLSVSILDLLSILRSKSLIQKTKNQKIGMNVKSNLRNTIVYSFFTIMLLKTEYLIPRQRNQMIGWYNKTT